MSPQFHSRMFSQIIQVRAATMEKLIVGGDSPTNILAHGWCLASTITRSSLKESADVSVTTCSLMYPTSFEVGSFMFIQCLVLCNKCHQGTPCGGIRALRKWVNTSAPWQFNEIWRIDLFNLLQNWARYMYIFFFWLPLAIVSCRSHVLENR